jgi:Uma2 family endonuclease
MAISSSFTEQEYLALAAPQFELWDGELREKPAMSVAHDNLAFKLGFMLQGQLDWNIFQVNVNGGKARVDGGTYFIPDVVVIPVAYQAALEGGSRAFNVIASPLPLVVEVWSPSTGAYDFERKLVSYRGREDQEIWYIHPYERTLTAWRRLEDGSYEESVYTGGIVPLSSISGITIDLDDLLA